MLDGWFANTALPLLSTGSPILAEFFFLWQKDVGLLALYSFPTRRSSDLTPRRWPRPCRRIPAILMKSTHPVRCITRGALVSGLREDKPLYSGLRDLRSNIHSLRICRRVVFWQSGHAGNSLPLEIQFLWLN